MTRGPGTLFSLQPTGDGPLTLVIEDLDLQATDRSVVSAVRSESPTCVVTLVAERTSFVGFRTPEGVNGSAIHLPRVDRVCAHSLSPPLCMLPSRVVCAYSLTLPRACSLVFSLGLLTGTMDRCMHLLR